MKKPRKDPSSYVVGYCKPPQHSRFKPGDRGNPSGRPRRRKTDPLALVKKVLARKVGLKDGHTERSAALLEGILLSIGTKALKGDLKSGQYIFQLHQLCHASESANAPDTLGADDLAIIEQYLAQFLEPSEGADEPKPTCETPDDDERKDQ